MYRRLLVIILTGFGLLAGPASFAQNACPVNIGFENGNFAGWTTYNGNISPTGVITVTPGPPVDSVHTILKNVSPQQRDTFGGFPVNCPNGSGYSIRLGNRFTGAQAQRVGYTFVIPADQNDYSIIYNYAVVLQDNGHKSFEQPKLTAKVFDVAANKYLECGSFEFIAAPNLPGFKESAVERNIYYKDWAPVTVKLAGYAGKTMRLEFTVNDCSQGIHFGYAYLDVDENCTTPITGNTYCNGTSDVVLKAPYGFSEYKWYDEQSNLVGTGNTLRLTPPPAHLTKYRLEIIPFPGQGCQDTLETTIIAANAFMKLAVQSSIGGCASSGANLTAPSVTAGSTAGLKLEYFTDSTQAEFLADPAFVTKSGTYYIKATAPSGCTEIRPVSVALKQPLQFVINTYALCAAIVDLTAADVTAGSEAGLTYTYWTDSAATVSVGNPKNITASGKYFIKATNAEGCSSIRGANVNVGGGGNVVLKDIHSCGEIAFTQANPSAGSDPSVKFSYWKDAATTIALAPAELFKTNTVIYAKVETGSCVSVRPVQVNIHANPVFTVTEPPPTTRPATIDLSATVPSTGSWTYSYWLDQQTTKAVSQPTAIAVTGTYYIKATDVYGCNTINPVTVSIIDPPVIPPNAFSPNNDGINDTWLIPILSSYANCIVEVFTRDGKSIFRSNNYNTPWDGKYKGRSLPPATYYYLIWLTPDRKPISGSVTVLK